MAITITCCFSTKQYVKNVARPDIFVILSDYKNTQRVHIDHAMPHTKHQK